MGIVFRRSLAVLPVLALAAAAALAQIPDLSQLPNVDYNPILLINPAVIKELHVPPAVASKLQAAFMDEAMNKVLPSLTGGGNAKAVPQAQRTKRTLATIEHMETRLASMLTPAQRLRWRQLTLQSIGAAAALQPKVEANLGMNPGQRGRLATAISDANEPVAARLRGGMSPDHMPELTRLQNEAKQKSNQALLAILTPAQRTRWRSMLGKPMNLSGFLGAPAMGLPGGR